MAELSIKIRIGNREYPMRVKAEDEERIRRAGKLLNEKIKNYQNQFGIDDTQDLVAMVAFDCLVEKLKREESSDASDDFALGEISKLNQLIADSI
ncbi:cell division protein ZapA [Ekhidna sp.]|uniref:cell division protein ZapA n=1 Tax=Ekhidna sp. TaxID=2608089 RepID=UPI003BAC1DAA